MKDKEKNNFIQVENYIIRVSEISFIKKTRKKGKYLHIYTDNFSRNVYYENYTKRDKDFKRILKELKGEIK